MNKLIIPIIVIAILAAGIGAFFAFQNPAYPEPQKQTLPQAQTNKLCGDGVCDDFEKAHPNACPQDCKSQTAVSSTPTQSATPITATSEQSTKTTKSQKQINWDSPFGIYSPYGEFEIDRADFSNSQEISGYLKDLGVKWVQELPFSKNFGAIPEDINIYTRIGREGGMKPGKDLDEKYRQALKESIRSNKGYIRYYEVDTEPDGVGGWGSNPQGYAELLKATYSVVKEECPECKVIFGGLSGGKVKEDLESTSSQFLEKVLESGAIGYFDGIEFKQHHIGSKDYPLIINKFEAIKKTLSRHGLDIRKMHVFMETATHDGNPNYPVPNSIDSGLSVQTEEEQAEGLIKIYVTALSSGVKKVFWNLIFERDDYEKRPDGRSFPQNPFNHYGLVSNPNNGGVLHKKLSYFSYKKMVEVLDGSDWNNIQTIQEKDGVYIYKFQKGGKKIWVAWNDNSAEKQITITGIGAQQVKITEAVPKYESGKEVTDYNTAFNTETKSVSAGKITITLDDKPVFVEEK
ncbi:MAG: hypothetical protein HY266_04240 [Deltaproteobacteria bacterium]|nr:hypothetical protein [Deltaproteobacteria bacterium]